MEGVMRSEELHTRPYIWIDEWVEIEFPQEGNDKRGQLIEVSDLGITLRHDRQGRHYEMFYPWSVVGGKGLDPSSHRPKDNYTYHGREPRDDTYRDYSDYRRLADALRR